MLINKLTLDNIVEGRLPEVWNKRVLPPLLKNIRDPNTAADQKRTITLEFTFSPHADRCSADVTIGVKEKLASIEPLKGSIYISSMGGELNAYPRDPRQEVLFEENDDASQQ
jgi:hypothetical protein